MTHINSMRAYQHLGDLTPRHTEIIDALQKLGRATDRQVQEHLGYTERNHVQPRISELIQMQILEEAGDEYYEATGEMVRTTRLKRAFVQRNRLKEYTSMFIDWSKCRNCALHTQRRKVVFGRGNLRAPIFVVGYAPGRSEDSSGIPFVGSASRQLEHWFSKCSLSAGNDGNVFIANLVCCYPAGDEPNSVRPIRRLETEACLPHLTALLDLVYPQIVILLGSRVSEVFFKTSALLHFPFKYKGVSFYRTNDPDVYNVENIQERDAYKKRGEVEWRLIREAYQPLLNGDKLIEPTIVWNLPQAAKGD